MTTFSELGLSAKVLAAVEATGYTQPTPIQAEAIPHALERRDVLGIAQTGTGKTASFVLPMLTMLEKGRARARMPRTLIIEPTRELAAQVEESFARYGKEQKLNVALLIGGMSFEEQDKKLDRGCDVLIATPGRLLDHFERGKLLLTGVEILVIDEADRMLDMGFIPDIERICKLLPFTRQTLFFSATMPPEITKLTQQFLQNPVRVEVAKPASAALTVEQRLVASGAKDYDKRARLRDLLRANEDVTNAIIFCNRKRDVSTLFRSLEKHGFSAGALHGDMDQRARMTMLHNFREDKLQLLVASDVAARGLDIPAVSHVFNFDVPIHAEDYVHRIGRTGRAGRSGKAFTLVTKSETKHLDAIKKLIGTEIEWLDGDLSKVEVTESDEGEGDRRSRSRGGSGRGGRNRKGRSRGGADKDDQQQQDDVAAKADDPKPQNDETETEDTVEAVAIQQNDNARKPNSRAHNGSRSRSGERGGRGGRGRSSRDDSNTMVGFGDDIPAFMLIATGT
ncbi:ATP-dependent helicase, DEAD-box:DEAD/DEAH box helicase:Helicase, C-terminal:ATP/GTP-binding site motif A (P-loop) [Fulvimarina pelagi HTCC2506]|uniref:DEAD-box ATP-dependent RNA helicase RhpA n=1 Tax=Fulvimarina pelagi HTCC2506 TaxID=314231 RepID=Q0G796_9HYPH|nr:DEAD/DEAH box helicase [Fulvimarina pelagi]EAU42468.1 ATP-dependent helicase, DEAD-box:DEAD/DEAH box helicase:Helicase, C-terminal:ATP/GTP-binding site motif A (P-loop) [Fulvimarina pelagi HTCC2506]